MAATTRRTRTGAHARIRGTRERGTANRLRLPFDRIPTRHHRTQTGARLEHGRNPARQRRARLQRTSQRPLRGFHNARLPGARRRIRTLARVPVAAAKRYGVRIHPLLPARQRARDCVRAVALVLARVIPISTATPPARTSHAITSFRNRRTRHPAGETFVGPAAGCAVAETQAVEGIA